MIHPDYDDTVVLRLELRLWFNQSPKYLGVLDPERNEERIPIETLDDTYSYADQLKATVELIKSPPAPTANYLVG